ncbi:MAG: CoA ester lyase [Sphingomonas bacterium]|uniref:HpcH/HpaI aldolase/citrate lyase family protein n=1 Tax=Sphingomonas bacterium TaxID=1895847 RepID=UPI0026213E4D|nr:CoA ester lyase [Sphingomonas bacterium]MDB5709526.1 CoA ester lyase [Sphingomonas bacterium]
MTLRSALYMPASNARAIEKARSLPADAIILDLEDSVAPDAKVLAREQAIGAARDGGFGARPLVLRVNGLDTEWGGADCRAAAGVGFDAILLPKVSHPDDLSAARALLGPVPLWAMIETCAAMLALPAIVGAAKTHDLRCLILGPNDLAKDMRCTPGADRMPLLPHLVAIVTAARAYGLIALDGVCNAIGDTALLEAECAQGAGLGFDGKTLIHPSHIDIANAAFAPSAERIAWARRIIAAFTLPENADKGAIQLGGEMIERLHLAEAERVVGLA